MTCIVGLKRGGQVYIASDSLASAGDMGMELGERKVNKLGGNRDAVFGLAGDPSYIGDLKYDKNIISAKKLKKRTVDEEYMKMKVAPYLRDLMTETNPLAGEYVGSNLLIGIHDKMYVFYGGVMLEPKEDFFAIGSGGEYAKAVMYALRDKDLEPEEVLRLALESAVHYSVSCGGDFYMSVTGEKGVRKI